MRILVADDALLIRRLLGAQLAEAGYEVVTADNGPDALAILTGQEPPLMAILDWMMPGLDGIEVCRELRRRGNAPYVHVILLTSRDDAASLIEALDAGADDFLTKPFKLAELEARLRAGKRAVALQQELSGAREALLLQSKHDSLTDSLNRRDILELLEIERIRNLRQALPFGVMFVEVDHFQGVNETHGRPAGDAILVEVAARLKQAIRPYDSVGRYEGEKFVVGLPGCDAAKASVVGERLRQMISQEPVAGTWGSLVVTVSVGLATTESIPVGTLDDLLAAADGALQRAKARGSNCQEVAQRSP